MAYATVNPATGEIGPSFAEHSDAEVAQALDTAASAYVAWRTRSIADRAGIVRKAASLLRDRGEAMARLITLEMGKLLVEAKGEVELSAQILEYYADNAEAFLAPYDIEQEDGTATVVSDPIGIVFAIEPWNFPYCQVVRVAGPNLVTGNVVILKHAGGIPQCAEAIARVFAEAGAPDGVFTNLWLSNAQSSIIIRNSRVQGVALTGSNRAGAAVASEAGKVTKKTTMELGGSDRSSSWRTQSRHGDQVGDVEPAAQLRPGLRRRQTLHRSRGRLRALPCGDRRRPAPLSWPPRPRQAGGCGQPPPWSACGSAQHPALRA